MLKYKNSYVIEDLKGTHWYFYFEPDEGINCIIKPIDEKESAPENLVNTSTDEFSVDIDRDFIYLLYSDINNELNLLIWNGKIWSKSPLMKNPINGSIQSPNIILDNGFVHITYEVNNKKDNGYYLVHHFWNKSKWSSYVVANSSNKIPYFLTKGSSGLYGMYIEKEQLMYSNFNYTSNSWTKPVIIGNARDTDNPFIYMNSANNSIHILYSIDDKLHYVRKTSGNWPSNNEQNKILFSDGVEYPNILFIGGNLWALWYSKGFLYTCLSADNGDTWSEPFKISSEVDSLSICNFISLKKPEFSRTRAFYHIKNPYYLILIDDIFEPHSSGFSYFTFYINQIQQYINQLSNSLQEEKNKNKELIKNMQKIESYYKDLSTQYSLLKNSYGNLLRIVDNLKSEYENIKKENTALKKELEKANSGLIKKIFPWSRS
ncbi:MAG: hypothetical protein QME46_05110 [Thermoanaerobacteraceae bacterium]|nr:hypothetical protein [Thermoanaerobacteraceae bacterium]